MHLGVRMGPGAWAAGGNPRSFNRSPPSQMGETILGDPREVSAISPLPCIVPEQVEMALKGTCLGRLERQRCGEERVGPKPSACFWSPETCLLGRPTCCFPLDAQPCAEGEGGPLPSGRSPCGCEGCEVWLLCLSEPTLQAVATEAPRGWECEPLERRGRAWQQSTDGSWCYPTPGSALEAEGTDARPGVGREGGPCGLARSEKG